jgi:N-formylglutamate deformylase
MAFDKPAPDLVVSSVRPRRMGAPLVFDVPHAGRIYPADFRPAVPLSLLYGGEDRFVDELVERAPERGAHLVVARFARTYIDPTRRVTDVDEGLLEGPWPVPVETSPHAALGVGLVFRLIGQQMPIYDRKLPIAEVEHRIRHYYEPYHARLSEALDSVQNAYDRVYYISFHSMSSVGNALSPDEGCVRADFVLGDRDGTSCAPEFTAFVAQTLRKLGYSVALNDPYKGAELVARHGRPEQGRHALQIEIRRGLYMNERTLEKHAGFEGLRASLDTLMERLFAWASERAKAASAAPGP